MRSPAKRAVREMQVVREFIKEVGRTGVPGGKSDGSRTGSFIKANRPSWMAHCFMTASSGTPPGPNTSSATRSGLPESKLVPKKRPMEPNQFGPHKGVSQVVLISLSSSWAISMELRPRQQHVKEIVRRCAS